MSTVVDEAQLAKLAQEQEALAADVLLPMQPADGYVPQNGDVLCTLDVQYVGEVGCVAADLFRWPNEPVTTISQKIPVTFPYIPQYFSFREGPLLQQMVTHVVNETKITPSCLLIDGHGRAHPRLLGIACWVGLALDLPTIGCAKEPLLPFDKTTLATPRGSTQNLYRVTDVERVDRLGVALVTQDGVRPVFVSVGHRIALDTAVEMILHLASRYRLPEPIRRADQLARRASKNDHTHNTLTHC